MSVSISRRRPRMKVWSLDEILEEAPVTERRHKSKQKYESKAKSTDVKKKSTEEKKKKTWRFPLWW
ncbi:hypothetical protein TELCIR_05877 [Teladorsagia circumcincta]|uniref:Uncharacterized protein n=1 Tax=Teladorsagia circumcincta TaxID=45464 RepID=A0A2G9UPK3_TELCI|nr:hypothetical protein TELCIR_05877 [Teladorsagia circumcincta]